MYDQTMESFMSASGFTPRCTFEISTILQREERKEKTKKNKTDLIHQSPKTVTLSSTHIYWSS